MAEVIPDLMHFEDSENRQPAENCDDADNDEIQENEPPTLPPSLLQSPVIVNSILKQSTKDNLIQLYTPVQKPEKGKLKVGFL